MVRLVLFRARSGYDEVVDGMVGVVVVVLVVDYLEEEGYSQL